MPIRSVLGLWYLTAIRQLIPKNALQLAAEPDMWGDDPPSEENIQQLADTLIAEWTRALRHMLRHWETPPTLAN